MKKNNNLAIQQFKIDISELTANQKKVITKLIEAAKLIAPIYAKQENPKFPGSNFYPHDAAKEEIERVAIADPLIFDPYTMVKRDKKGKLFAVPYHIEFREQLMPIAKLLKQAAEISESRDFARRLKFQADALLDGTYEASDIYWLSMKPYKLDIVIGPIERIDDHLFFKKCSYQAWVGVRNDVSTKKAVKLQQAFYTSHRKVLAPSEKADFLQKIQLRVDKTLIFSGLIARGMFTSTNLPNNVALMEKYGSEITFFDPSLDYKFENQHYPIFKRIFEKDCQDNFGKDLLRFGSFGNVLLHEIGHSLLRYKDSEIRLKENFPVIDEISATVFGIKACGPLLLKGAISQKEIEAIMIMFICRAFTWWLDSQKTISTIYFATGHAIVLNYLFSSGALKEINGICWSNFWKMYVVFDELAATLERLISIGTYLDSNIFIEKYGSFDTFKRFKSSLKGVE